MASFGEQILAELEWRGALAEGDKALLLAAVSGASGDVLPALLAHGIDEQEVLTAAAAAAGLTTAPKRLLIKPQPTRLDLQACFKWGGVPIGERRGTPLVAFADPDQVLDAAVHLPSHQALLALPGDLARAKAALQASAPASPRVQSAEPAYFDGDRTMIATDLPPGIQAGMEQEASALPPEFEEASTMAVSPLAGAAGAAASDDAHSWLPDNPVLAAAARTEDRRQRKAQVSGSKTLASEDPANRPPQMFATAKASDVGVDESLAPDLGEMTIVNTDHPSLPPSLGAVVEVNAPPTIAATAGIEFAIDEQPTSVLEIESHDLGESKTPSPGREAAFGGLEAGQTRPEESHLDGPTIQSEPLADAVGDVASSTSDPSSSAGKSQQLEIPGYDLRGLLGKGGMASVHLALDEKTNKEVALKILDEHLAGDEIFIERFRREVASTQKLQHENIIRLFDAGQSGDTYYMVTEFIDGGTLSELLRSTGPMPVALVAPLIDMALSGLHYAHQKGTVHRDLKPANLMLNKQGVLKIGDFGIAKTSNDETLTQTGTLFGTPAYMSPEQAMGRDIDHRSDLFSIGIVFYQLLTGLNPFHSENPSTSLYKIANGKFPPLFSLMPWVPDALDQVVRRLLEVDRDERFPNGEAAREVLAPLLRLLRDQQPDAVAKVLLDPRANTQRMRQQEAQRQVDHGLAHLRFEPPRREEAAFRFFLSTRLDETNYEASNQLTDLRLNQGFTFEPEMEPRLAEVHKALKDGKKTPALLRRAHDLHAAQKDLFGIARFGKQYLQLQPDDAHMQLKVQLVLGDDPLAPFSAPPVLAPEFKAASTSADDIVVGLMPAGGPIRGVANPTPVPKNQPSNAARLQAGGYGAVAVADAKSGDDVEHVKTGAEADLAPVAASGQDEKSEAPNDSLEDFKEALRSFKKELVRSLTGDAGVEGLKAWWNDRFNSNQKEEFRAQAQQLIDQGRDAFSASKEKLLDEKNRARLSEAGQGFWQRHRRVILLLSAVFLSIWLLQFGCSVLWDVATAPPT